MMCAKYSTHAEEVDALVAVLGLDIVREIDGVELRETVERRRWFEKRPEAVQHHTIVF